MVITITNNAIAAVKQFTHQKGDKLHGTLIYMSKLPTV